MGQATRQAKHNKFWSWVGRPDARRDGWEAINMLLCILTDEQLDEALTSIEDAKVDAAEDDQESTPEVT